MDHEQQLAAWIEQEEAITRRLDANAGAGVSRPDQVAGKTRLEMMEA